MSKRLYVGNLPYSVDDDGLRNIFTPFGEVASAEVIMDRYSGRSKGFGFVEMNEAEAADKAVSDLNGTEVDGRPIKVNEARERKQRGNNFRGGGRGSRDW